MNKKTLLVSCVIGASMALSGCAESFDHIPPLTEQEQAVIEEYAVGAVLSASSANRRLATVAEITYYDEREALRNKALGRVDTTVQEPEPEEEMMPDIQDAEAVDNTAADASAGTSIPEESAAPAFSGIAEFCKADGFDITYTGYKVLTSYPESGDEGGADLYFAMDSTPGHDLLVVFFSASNITNQDKELNIMDSGVRFRINVNDNDSSATLTTLLLDDLSSYVGTIPAGGSEKLVLIREVPENTQISSLGITLRGVDDTVSTRLA